MDDYQEVANIIHEKVHEDANIFIGLVINDEMGEKIQVTAIATGFGNVFEKSRRQTDGLNRPPAIEGSLRDDLDIPTILRNQQQPEKPRASMRLGGLSDEEYEIPTFLRKRVD